MNLVILKTFDNYFLANITLTKLHAAGIECYLLDEFTVTVNPILSNAIGGIKLVVKKEDESIANNLLNTYEREYINAASCPKCGSHDFAYLAKPGATNYLTAIFTWIFSSYAVAPVYVYHCGQCGYESERLPETFIREPFNKN
jgi:Zn ribbon nucleic-acid-binding protein